MDLVRGLLSGHRQRFLSIENVLAAIGLAILLWTLEAVFVLAFAPSDAPTTPLTRTSEMTPLELSGVMTEVSGWTVIVALAATILGLLLSRAVRARGRSRPN